MNGIADLNAAQFTAALLDPALACPNGLRVWNGSAPLRRFAIHRNNVVSSLIDALADVFPVTRTLVGEDFFRAMAAVFVRCLPPRSKVLADYGAGFADFIAAFEPAREVCYLADVARIERARVDAFHAADADSLDLAGGTVVLARMGGADDLRFEFHPSFFIVESPYAVASIWAAHQGLAELADIDVQAAETVLIVRKGMEVLNVRIEPSAGRLVGELQRGAAWEAALLEQPGDDGANGAATLSMLLGHGAVTAIQPVRSASE